MFLVNVCNFLGFWLLSSSLMLLCVPTASSHCSRLSPSTTASTVSSLQALPPPRVRCAGCLPRSRPAMATKASRNPCHRTSSLAAAAALSAFDFVKSLRFATLGVLRFNPRFYIAAATDNMSLQKAQLLENSLAAENGTRASDNTAQFMKIYRSREVGQSYLTSVWTTLIAMVHALWLMIKIRPEVILCNGPGTCIPLCAIAFMFKMDSGSS